MENFSIEEINLMCIYDTGTRNDLLIELENVLPILAKDEAELSELIQTVIAKLRRMSDLNYSQLVFLPDYEEEDETT
ncbi:MAG: transposon-transfer assisting family protein [Saccharofermentanales bacterium]